MLQITSYIDGMKLINHKIKENEYESYRKFKRFDNLSK